MKYESKVMIPSKLKIFKNSISKYIMICPICHTRLIIKNNSMFCSNNHNYNINKKGYINLEPNKKLKLYNKDLFDNRRLILEKKYYEHLTNGLNAIIKDFKCENVIDIGSGEGTFLNSISCESKVGIDLAQAGIHIASSYIDCAFIVGDLSNIPFADNSFDCVFNILTPANYEEFKRVLKNDGILVKVIPGTNYINEIRNQLNFTDYENQSERKLNDNCEIIRKETIYNKKVFRHDFLSFLKMLPIYNNLTNSQISLIVSKLSNTAITLDLTVIIAKIL